MNKNDFLEDMENELFKKDIGEEIDKSDLKKIVNKVIKGIEDNE